MANIIKAMKLDFDLVKVYVKAICFTLLIPVVFAIINRSLMTSVSFATCFIAMASGYTFSISEKNGMERLYGILNITNAVLLKCTLLHLPEILKFFRLAELWDVMMTGNISD